MLRTEVHIQVYRSPVAQLHFKRIGMSFKMVSIVSFI